MQNNVRICALSAPIDQSDLGLGAQQAAERIAELAQQHCPDLIFLPHHSFTGGSLGSVFQNGLIAEQGQQLLPYLLSKTAMIKSAVLFTLPDGGGESCYICQAGQLLGQFRADSAAGLFTFTLAGSRAAVLFCDPAQLVRHAGDIARSGAQILLLPACQPCILGYSDRVLRQIKEVSAALGICVALCQGGLGGSSSPWVFEPQTAVFESGQLLDFGREIDGPPVSCVDIDLDILAAGSAPASFEAACHTQPVEGQRTLMRPLRQNPYILRPEQLDELFALQVKSLAVRMENTGIKNLVIAVSGGLDSTLALLVCAGACDRLGLGHEHITAITMPGFGTTGRTYQNAKALISALGCALREIPIKDSVQVHFTAIGHDGQKKDVTYENAQARERTQIALDIANTVGGFVVGTGDLSEAALGFCTFGGDALANFNVNICLPKTVVRQVAGRVKDRFYGAGEVVQDILDTPVSPELLPPDETGEASQKTEEILGEYDLLDFILYYHLKYGMHPQKLYYYACVAFSQNYSADYIKEKLQLFYRRFFASQFKRAAAPESAILTEVCLHTLQFQMPGDMSAKLFLHAVEEL